MLWLAFIYATHSMEMQKMGGFGFKDCLPEASLGWKLFGKYNENQEFCTCNDKYVRFFVRKSIKVWSVRALNRYFESNQCEEILNISNKNLNLNDYVISNTADDILKYFNFKRDEFQLEFETGEKNYPKKRIR